MKIVLNTNSKIAIQQMEDMGFVTIESFLQLAHQYPEIYYVASDILGIPNNKIYPHIKNNRIESVAFVPALIKGLEEIFANTLTGTRMELNIAMGKFISSFTKKDLVWIVIIALVLSSIAFLTQGS